MKNKSWMISSNIQRMSLFIFVSIFMISCTKDIDPQLVSTITGVGENVITKKKVVDPLTFSSYPASSRNTIFHEDFNNNDSGWYLVDSTSQIKNGFYDSKGTALILTRKVNIDESKDFELDCTIGYRNISYGETNGIIMNYNSTSKYYWGILNGQGFENTSQNTAYIGYYNYYNTSIGKSKATNFIIPTSSNEFNYDRYTLRKVGDSIITFIDTTRISTVPYIRTSGNRIGICDNTGLSIDNIYIDYLN